MFLYVFVMFCGRQKPRPTGTMRGRSDAQCATFFVKFSAAPGCSMTFSVIGSIMFHSFPQCSIVFPRFSMIFYGFPRFSTNFFPRFSMPWLVFYSLVPIVAHRCPSLPIVASHSFAAEGDSWGDLCQGHFQSPIDIEPKNARPSGGPSGRRAMV